MQNFLKIIEDSKRTANRISSSAYLHFKTLKEEDALGEDSTVANGLILRAKISVMGPRRERRKEELQVNSGGF